MIKSIIDAMFNNFAKVFIGTTVVTVVIAVAVAAAIF